jgi:hypothetical protein
MGVATWPNLHNTTKPVILNALLADSGTIFFCWRGRTFFKKTAAELPDKLGDLLEDRYFQCMPILLL